jgi:hypothetical protein
MGAGPRRTTLVPLALAALAASISCGDVVRQGRAPTFLVIDRLQGASGVNPNQLGSTLASDVVTKGTIFEDPGSAQMRILLKDPGNPGAPATPSNINSVTINRYRVTYRRSDGRNTPGVDVPYAFDGATTVTVTNLATPVAFTLVRAQAKLEAPLRALVGAGGRILISTIADVTFYGRDQAGNEVTQTGSISVNFSDWADPE